MRPSKTRLALLMNFTPTILIGCAVVLLCSVGQDISAQQPEPVVSEPVESVMPDVDGAGQLPTRTILKQSFMLDSRAQPVPSQPIEPVSAEAGRPDQLPTPAFLNRSIKLDDKADPNDKKEPENDEKKEPAPKKKQWDEQTVSRGQSAFSQACVKCHNAQRSLSKTKTYPDWLKTVQRMAAMRDAEVPNSDIVPIATYLASRNPDSSPPGDEAGGGSAASKDAKASSFSPFLMIAPSFRQGSSDLQDPGFVPNAWFGGSWNGEVLSARASGCVSCHTGNRIELVEAAVRADLSKWMDDVRPGTKGGIEAGRFLVPFSALSDAPMNYTMVSRPLIFTMGQWIYPTLIGQSVLPMPYVDQGANVNLSTPICEVGSQMLRANWDGYVINGLTGNNSSIDWVSTRAVFEQNQSPAFGTRLTVGTPMLRAGVSYMSGNFLQSGNAQFGSTGNVVTTTPLTTAGNYAGNLNYAIWGCDLVFKYENLIRFQIEYAHRSNDRFDATITRGGRSVFEENTAGYYAELEARPTREFPVSALARYDYFTHDSPLSPPGSTLPGDFYIQRFTYGFNFSLWRDSVLMLNHEHWFFPQSTGLSAKDVFGMRFQVTF